jgi:hypothetical protein
MSRSVTDFINRLSNIIFETQDKIAEKTKDYMTSYSRSGFIPRERFTFNVLKMLDILFDHKFNTIGSFLESDAGQVFAQEVKMSVKHEPPEIQIKVRGRLSELESGEVSFGWIVDRWESLWKPALIEKDSFNLIREIESSIAAGEHIQKSPERPYVGKAVDDVSHFVEQSINTEIRDFVDSRPIIRDWAKIAQRRKAFKASIKAMEEAGTPPKYLVKRSGPKVRGRPSTGKTLALKQARAIRKELALKIKQQKIEMEKFRSENAVFDELDKGITSLFGKSGSKRSSNSVKSKTSNKKPSVDRKKKQVDSKTAKSKEPRITSKVKPAKTKDSQITKTKRSTGKLKTVKEVEQFPDPDVDDGKSQGKGKGIGVSRSVRPASKGQMRLLEKMRDKPISKKYRQSMGLESTGDSTTSKKPEVKNVIKAEKDKPSKVSSKPNVNQSEVVSEKKVVETKKGSSTPSVMKKEKPSKPKTSSSEPSVTKPKAAKNSSSTSVSTLSKTTGVSKPSISASKPSISKSNPENSTSVPSVTKDIHSSEKQTTSYEPTLHNDVIYGHKYGDKPAIVAKPRSVLPKRNPGDFNVDDEIDADITAMEMKTSKYRRGFTPEKGIIKKNPRSSLISWINSDESPNVNVPAVGKPKIEKAKVERTKVSKSRTEKPKTVESKSKSKKVVNSAVENQPTGKSNVDEPLVDKPKVTKKRIVKSKIDKMPTDKQMDNIHSGVVGVETGEVKKTSKGKAAKSEKEITSKDLETKEETTEESKNKNKRIISGTMERFLKQEEDRKKEWELSRISPKVFIPKMKDPIGRKQPIDKKEKMVPSVNKGLPDTKKDIPVAIQELSTVNDPSVNDIKKSDQVEKNIVDVPFVPPVVTGVVNIDLNDIKIVNDKKPRVEPTPKIKVPSKRKQQFGDHVRNFDLPQEEPRKPTTPFKPYRPPKKVYRDISEVKDDEIQVPPEPNRYVKFYKPSNESNSSDKPVKGTTKKK